MNTKTSPLVSIIMPAYNAEKYIAEAIQSVLDQTYQNWELIIINDGSRDNTENIINFFSDTRIVVHTQKNSGVSTARNKGLEHAKGEYITFLDADDVLPSYAIEKKVNFLNVNKDIGMVHGNILIVSENLKQNIETLKTFKYDNLQKKILHLDTRLSFNIGYMLRSVLIKNIRFQEEMTHAEDILFLLQLCVNNIKYGYIDMPMYLYRVTNTSAMSNMQGWRQGYLDLLKYINNIPSLSYFDTLLMRIKIFKMLILWHIKEKNIEGMLDVYYIFKG